MKIENRPLGTLRGLEHLRFADEIEAVVLRTRLREIKVMCDVEQSVVNVLFRTACSLKTFNGEAWRVELLCVRFLSCNIM